MPRRNSGPRLRFLEKRQCFYIVWSEGGRSRERSTGTSDRKLAEAKLGEFIHLRTRTNGPRDPDKVLVADVLADYAEERGPHTQAQWRINAAAKTLLPLLTRKTLSQINLQTCPKYSIP